VISDFDIANVKGAPKRVLIVAGEASGDLYGGELIREVKKLSSDVVFYGVGGKKMREAGLVCAVRTEDLTVVGLFEVIKHIGPIKRALSLLKDTMSEIKPDLVVLIDFPDFNFRVAKSAKKAGIPVFYYISPQVWAWRRGRVRTMAKLIDKMIVIFPFEVEIFKEAGIDVEFLGHPLMDVISAVEGNLVKEEKKGIKVALLPGSRIGEIKRHMAPLLGAGEIIKERYPNASFVVPVAPTLALEEISSYLDGSKISVGVMEDSFQQVVKSADIALVSSGTATIETALLGTPMVVIYRLNPLTYILARLLIRVDYIAMVNLVAGRLVVPELIQWDVTAENVAGCALEILESKELIKKMREDLLEVRGKIGNPGASKRVAERVMQFL
jgi:lipid-A-disaccharide synthase